MSSQRVFPQHLYLLLLWRQRQVSSVVLAWLKGTKMTGCDWGEQSGVDNTFLMPSWESSFLSLSLQVPLCPCAAGTPTNNPDLSSLTKALLILRLLPPIGWPLAFIYLIQMFPVSQTNTSQGYQSSVNTHWHTESAQNKHLETINAQMHICWQVNVIN